MKRLRTSTIALIAAITLVVAGIWFARSRSEPVYHGKPISYWIQPGPNWSEVHWDWEKPWHHWAESDGEVQAVYAEMDDRAIDWLIQQLEWQPSALAEFGNRWLGEFGVVLRDDPDLREPAAMALAKLGTRARRAAPALRINARVPPANNHRSVYGPAGAALVRIREDSLQDLIRRTGAWNTTGDRLAALAALSYLGPEASDAVSVLVSLISPENPPVIRLAAVDSLKRIARRPEDCVPQLLASLGHFSEEFQIAVLQALTAFGPAASGSLVEVLEFTQSTNRGVSMMAGLVLRNVATPTNSPRAGLEAPPEPR